MPRSRDDSKGVPRKKQHITDAAIALFQKFGMRRVTVAEICEKANVSKMTFYKYFPNKIELTKHVLDELSEEILAHIDEIRTMDVPLTTKIELWIANRVELAARLSPEFLEELYNVDEELKDFVRKRSDANARHFVDFLSEAQANGELRPDLSPALIALVIDKLNTLGRSERALSLCDHNWSELTRAVNTVFFYGILAPRG